MSTDNDNFEQPTEEQLEEVSTRPDYLTVLDTIYPQETIRTFFKHQKQMIAWSLEAESSPPIEDDGQYFYSRCGVNACTPGSGKTAPMLGISFYEVPEPYLPDNIMSTTLCTIILKPPKREYIPCSIYMAPNTLLENWKNDCNSFFGPGRYYEVLTPAKIMEQIRAENFIVQDYQSAQLNTQLNNVEAVIKKLGAIRVANRTEQDKQYLAAYKVERERLKGLLASSGDDVVTNFLIHKMKQYKIIIVGATSFQYLIPCFDKVQCARLFIDEMQDILITNQDNFRQCANSEVIDFLLEGKGKRQALTYRQYSPVRFIWLVTATAYLIPENEQTKSGGVHYFNSWIGRNVPFIRDYVNAASGNYVLPELVKRYIIKFPDSYIKKIIYGDANLVRYHVLKCRKPIESQILEGTLDESFDEYLENDDKVGMMRALKIENPNQILEAVIYKLQEKIQEVEKRMSEYKAEGDRLANLLEKGNEEIKGYQEKIALIYKRLEILSGSISSPCAICMESMENKELLVCNTCYNPCHSECMINHFKSSGNTNCPFCRTELNKNNLMKIDAHAAGEVARLKHADEGENGEYVFESKLEALYHAVKQFRKVLLYLNTSDTEDEVNIVEIARTFASMGYNVRVPMTLTKQKKFQLYGQLEDRIIIPRSKREIGKDLEDFERANRPTIWIMKTASSSSGLNLPFIDLTLCYSVFRQREQIIGRGLRPARLKSGLVMDFIELVYV